MFSKEVENDALVANMDPSRLSCYPWREGDVKQREGRLRWRLLEPFEMERGLHVGQHIIFSLCQLFFVFALLILFCIVVVVAPRRR